MNRENLKLSKRHDWESFITPDYVVTKQGESFDMVLTRYIVEMQFIHRIKQKEIADESGIESSMITKYKKGTRKPTLNAVILLCLAMRLAPERSCYLFYCAGFQLNDSVEHRIYKLFLQGCAFSDDYSIKNCNVMLREHGFTQLST